jgi:hypothetical protein
MREEINNFHYQFQFCLRFLENTSQKSEMKFLLKLFTIILLSIMIRGKSLNQNENILGYSLNNTEVESTTRKFTKKNS